MQNQDNKENILTSNMLPPRSSISNYTLKFNDKEYEGYKVPQLQSNSKFRRSTSRSELSEVDQNQSQDSKLSSNRINQFTKQMPEQDSFRKAYNLSLDKFIAASNKENRAQNLSNTNNQTQQSFRKNNLYDYTTTSLRSEYLQLDSENMYTIPYKSNRSNYSQSRQQQQQQKLNPFQKENSKEVHLNNLIKQQQDQLKVLKMQFQQINSKPDESDMQIEQLTKMNNNKTLSMKGLVSNLDKLLKKYTQTENNQENKSNQSEEQLFNQTNESIIAEIN